MKKLLSLGILAGLLFLNMAAQETSDIYGKVLLPDGGPLPGVNIKLTGDVTGEKTLVSSNEGNFRFSRLSPGTYNIEFSLEGFKSVLRKGVRLQIGTPLTVNVVMETSTIQETVTVVGETGQINTRKVTISRNVTSSELQNLPVARNPYSVIELTPGVLIGQTDVSGTKIGEDVGSFYGQGSDMRQNRYALDGANVEGGNYTGELGVMVNMNTMEETSVTTSSHDISNTTGGVQVNFVTKRAGNKMSGSMMLMFMDKSLEMSYDMPAAFLARGQTVPQGVNHLYEYGANLGGPLIKDHLFLFGSWAAKDAQGRTMLNSLIPDFQRHFYLKANFQWKNTSGELSYSNINHQGDNWVNPTIWKATFDIIEPVKVYTAQLHQAFGNLLIDAKFTLGDAVSTYAPHGYPIDIASRYDRPGNDTKTYNPVGRDFTMDPRAVPNYTSYPHSMNWWRFINKNRPYYLLNANYFGEKILGGDHEIQLGADYEQAKEDQEWLIPNDRNCYDYFRANGTLVRVMTTSVPNVRYMQTPRTGIFFQDTASYGRLTATLGLRYDSYASKWDAVKIKPWRPYGQTVALWEPFLSNVSVPGGELPFNIHSFSPRLSLTYDLNKDGKNVIKASAARYSGQFSNMESIALGLRSAASYSFSVPWFDTNNNNICEFNEWTPVTPAQVRAINKKGNEELAAWKLAHPGVAPPVYNDPYWTYPDWDRYAATGFPNDGPPVTSKSTTVLDPNYKLRTIDEFTLGFERQLMKDLSAGVTLILKKAYNDQWARTVYQDGKFYDVPENLEVKYTLDGVQIWGAKFIPVPADHTYVTNYKNYHKSFLGLAFKLSKRLSSKWAMDLDYNYTNQKQWFDKTEFANATYWNNWDYFNGSEYAPSQYSSLRYFAGSHHTLRLTGLYQLPWQVTVSTSILAREGYPIQKFKLLSDGSSLYTGKYGDVRLPSVWYLNLALEKTFNIGEMKLSLVANAFNITNQHVTTQVQQFATKTGGIYDTPTELLAPGFFQFGVRMQF